MAVNKLVHVNESGLPLNAIEWLERHHFSKIREREQMIRDIRLKRGSYGVDAGCGPGLWIPLLARAIDPPGRIFGLDLSPEALVTPQRRPQHSWNQIILPNTSGSLHTFPLTPQPAT